MELRGSATHRTLAAASQAFGPWLVLLRAVPALFAGAGIYVTCLIVIEFGGLRPSPLSDRGLKRENPRRWVAIGLLMGVSMLSKYSVLFFAAALLMGLLFTPERRILYSRWFIVGVLISAALALPSFLFN